MAEGSRSPKRASSPNWLASLMGAVFLISAGFMLGLVVGVVKEEPELVMGHLAGQSEEVLWSETEGQGTPDVAAPGPSIDLPDEASQRGESWAAASVDDVPVAAAEDAASRAYAARPPAPPAPAPVAAPRREDRQTSGRSGFSVQVGAFAESGSAENIASELRGKGYPVYVTPSAGSQDGRWRVRVGPMSSRDEADQVAQQLKTRERLPTWVLSEGG